MLKIAPFAIAIMSISLPAFAGESPWVEVAPNAHIRLISSDVVKEGISHIAFELDMPQSTKTYWRIPGETGIPLSLDMSGSRDLAEPEILWPFPERESGSGFVDYVYHGDTVLPVAIKVGGPKPRVQATLLMGVCDDICVPVKVDLALDINADKKDMGQDLRIAQALAEVPLDWQQAEVPLSNATFDIAQNRLFVSYAPNLLEPHSVIVDTGNPAELFGVPQKSPDGDVLSFELIGQGAGLAQRAEPITFTFMTENGAYELSQTIELK